MIIGGRAEKPGRGSRSTCMAVPFLRQGDYPVVETEGNPYMEGVRELIRNFCKDYGTPENESGYSCYWTFAGYRIRNCRKRL